MSVDDDGIALALADELMDTVIHKFQIPGSGTQVKVQATAIKELMALLEKRSSVRFPQSTYDLVDIVKSQMPAVYGSVPSAFYLLRREIESTLSGDELLQHVVKVHIVRGSRNDFNVLLPVMRNPDIPEEFKESLMEGGIMAILGVETLDSAVAIIDRIGGDNKEKEKIYISTGAQSANEGSKLKAATMNKDWEAIARTRWDFYGQMELHARIDRVLDSLFSHYLSKLYD